MEEEEIIDFGSDRLIGNETKMLSGVEGVEEASCHGYIRLYRKILTSTLQALSIDQSSLDHLDEESSDLLMCKILAGIQLLKESASKDVVSSSLLWEEFIEEHLLAAEDVNSPIIMNVLNSWTADQKKINYFLHWSRSLHKPFDHTLNIPVGIQVTGVSNVLRDAFLVLVLPVLRHNCVDKIIATTREYNADTDHAIISSSTQNRIISSPTTATDPFIGSTNKLYDIRFKRVVGENDLSRARRCSDDYVCSSQPHFCSDGDDYSSLSEIDKVFKNLEKKAREEMDEYDQERMAKLRAAQKSNDVVDNKTVAPPSENLNASTWISNLSSWFIPNTTTNSSAGLTNLNQNSNRWSSFSTAPSNTGTKSAEDYSIDRRSASFSFMPLEAQAYRMVSDNSMLTSWWTDSNVKATTYSNGNSDTSDTSNLNTKGEQQTSSVSISSASSPDYLPGPLAEFEIYEKALTAQKNKDRGLPSTSASKTTGISVSSKNKDKIAARLAALREKQASARK